MNSTEQLYREAWDRLRARKPKIVDKDMPINKLDTVALEAGRKKGSLRKKNHPILCEEILTYELKETSLQKANRQIKEYKSDAEEKDRLWKDGLVKEIMLSKRIFELEIEIKRIKQKYPGIVFELEDLI